MIAYFDKIQPLPDDPTTGKDESLTIYDYMNVARFVGTVNLANAQKDIVLFVTTKESAVQYRLNHFNVNELVFNNMS